jgi:hypothetical protein
MAHSPQWRSMRVNPRKSMSPSPRLCYSGDKTAYSCLSNYDATYGFRFAPLLLSGPRI